MLQFYERCDSIIIEYSSGQDRIYSSSLILIQLKSRWVETLFRSTAQTLPTAVATAAWHSRGQRFDPAYLHQES